MYICISGFNLTKASRDTVDDKTLLAHRLVEAMKFGYGKRSYLGDEDFVNVTEVSELTCGRYVLWVSWHVGGMWGEWADMWEVCAVSELTCGRYVRWVSWHVGGMCCEWADMWEVCAVSELTCGRYVLWVKGPWIGRGCKWVRNDEVGVVNDSAT